MLTSSSWYIFSAGQTRQIDGVVAMTSTKFVQLVEAEHFNDPFLCLLIPLAFFCCFVFLCGAVLIDDVIYKTEWRPGDGGALSRPLLIYIDKAHHSSTPTTWFFFSSSICAVLTEGHEGWLQLLHIKSEISALQRRGLLRRWLETSQSRPCLCPLFKRWVGGRGISWGPCNSKTQWAKSHARAAVDNRSRPNSP